MKRFLRLFRLILLITAVAVCAGFLYVFLHAPVLAIGRDYTYYTQANSSAIAIRTDTPLLTKLFLPLERGESTVYEGNCLKELVDFYEAKFCFEEEVCGTHNYYFYSPKLGKEVQLEGMKVNLHIAIRQGDTAVGTPLIFGGY